jgi:hypothetical protein
LILFFAVVIVDLAPSAVAGFKAGYKAGREDTHGALTGGPRHILVTIEPTDPEAISQKFADGVEFRSVENSGELVVPELMGKMSIWATLWRILSAFALLWAIVTFLVRLVIFAIKFPRRRIMAHENIISMRWIAGSLGVYGLIEHSWILMDYVWVRSHVVLEGYRIGFELPSSALIVALILLAMSEIMNLAGRLQNEQDLTI